MSSAYQQLERINETLRGIAADLEYLGTYYDQGLDDSEMSGAMDATANVSSAIIDIEHILSSMEDRAQ